MLPLYMQNGQQMIKSSPVHQYIPQSYPYARQATYMGKKIAQLTNMTPFTRGQYVPVLVPSTDASHSRVVKRGATHQDTLASRQAPRQMMKRPTESKTAFSGVRDAGMVFGTYGNTARTGSFTPSQAQRDALRTSGSALSVGKTFAAQQQANQSSGSGFQQALDTIIGGAPAIIDAVQGESPSVPQTPVTLPQGPAYTPPAQAQAPKSNMTPYIVVGVASLAAVGILYGMAKVLAPDRVEEPKPFRRTL